jgi:isoleucyl-tRNA synthetase
MYKQLTDKLNYHELESEILKSWEANDIFKKSISAREGRPEFTFYEGPPTANGRPGIHHVMARTLKDIICRYKTMQGFQVHRKAGWDTHGLPVEIEVEKSLGLKRKDDIVAYGIAKFNEECKKSVWKYKVDWEELTRMMGYWVDLQHPYVTFDNNYIESIWWALKQYFDKGLIYKGYKIQPYCPRCETPLSSHEVSLGYKDVKDPSIYIKLKVKGEENTYFLVWTTTPWTLISNVAIAVHPDVDYVKVEHKGEKLILAEARLSVIGDEFVVLEKMKGQELLGIQYSPIFETPANDFIIKKEEIVSYKTYSTSDKFLLEHVSKIYLRYSPRINEPYNDEGMVIAEHNGERVLMPTVLYARLSNKVKLQKFPVELLSMNSVKIIFELGISPTTDSVEKFNAPQAFYVLPAMFVTTTDGSGIVHMAPAYGEDDFEIGKLFGLPTIHPVNKSGAFNSEVTDFAGMFVKDADLEIIQNLRHRNILYKKEQYLHSYPHCWRCSSPLLYYARESWYIRTTDYAKRMIELNKQINWIPPEVGAGRFGNWLEDNKDWAISRDRFWGTPLPIWLCEKCGKQKCIGSVEEFRKGTNVPEPLDLHKPYVDGVTFTCECGGTMNRTPELIDVWFDSGSMPFAQWHYPFENKEIFKKSYPADFISEGIDQTRGWFYTLHSIGTFLFDTPAYKNVLVNELILDKTGQKMSKTKGNTVDPFALMKKYGADSVRWYLISQSPVWRTTLFDEEGIGEVQRKFFSTLTNTYSFFALYANVDAYDNTEPKIPISERQEIDQWILSELNTLIKAYLQSLDGYDVTRAARAVSDFTIDQLSNWYVRRNRRRFWKSEKGKDKTAAYQTLHECLLTISKLIAPFAPFLADDLYRKLIVGNKSMLESVHLEEMPKGDASVIYPELEHRMEYAIKIVGLVRAMRMKSNLKVRQPLQKIILPVKSEADRQEIEQMEGVILEEINVKHIEYMTDESSLIKKKSKPNFKTLGPKFGKSVQPIAARLRDLTSEEMSKLQSQGTLMLNVSGTEYTIDTSDVEILHEDIQGWMVETDGQITVALDTALTDELIDEGLAREFVNRVQNLRKDSGFEVTDRIRIVHASSERLTKALGRMVQYVQQETLAVELKSISNVDALKQGAKNEDINGEPSAIAVEKN